MMHKLAAMARVYKTWITCALTLLNVVNLRFPSSLQTKIRQTVFALLAAIGLFFIDVQFGNSLVALAEPEPWSNVGEIVQGKEVVQEFEATEDNLQQVNVFLATFARTNNCGLRIRVVEVAINRTVAERYLNCRELPETKDYQLTFPPVDHSKSKQYKLILTSPDGTPSNAVTAYVNPYPELDGEGTLKVEGKEVKGGLVIHCLYRYGGYVARYWEVIELTFIFFLVLSFGLLFKSARQSLILNASSGTVSIRSLSSRAPLSVSLKSFLDYVSQRKFELTILGTVFVFYMLAVPYYGWIDEYDNILGGLSLNQGQLPYRDFFSQHLPFPFYLASLLTLFTGNDVWAFRAIFVFLLYLWSLSNYTLFKKYLNKSAGLLYLALLSISMMIYGGQMLLAETLIAYACVTLVLLILFKYGNNQIITLRGTFLVLGLVAVIALSSLAYLFLALFMYLSFAFLYLRQRISRITKLRIPLFLTISTVPYLSFAAYLAFTGSLKQFIFENYYFNTHYYAQFWNDEIQNGVFTSLVQIFRTFTTQAETAIREPLNSTNYPALLCLIGVVSVVGYWVQKRKWWYVCFFVVVIVLISPRSDTLTGQPWQGNFRASPYIIVSVMFSSISLIAILRHLKLHPKAMLLRTASYSLIIYMVLTSISTLSFDIGIYFGYLTTDPPTVISKGPTAVAKVVNDLTTPEDYVWVVPSDPESRLYLHAQQAMHYSFVHPWILVCEECKQQILIKLAVNKPKIIVWYPNVVLWGQNINYYADEILQYVKANYFKVENSKQGKLTNFYFLNEKKENIAAELVRKNYIGPIVLDNMSLHQFYGVSKAE